MSTNGANGLNKETIRLEPNSSVTHGSVTFTNQHAQAAVQQPAQEQPVQQPPVQQPAPAAAEPSILNRFTYAMSFGIAASALIFAPAPTLVTNCVSTFAAWSTGLVVGLGLQRGAVPLMRNAWRGVKRQFASQEEAPEVAANTATLLAALAKTNAALANTNAKVAALEAERAAEPQNKKQRTDNNSAVVAQAPAVAQASAAAQAPAAAQEAAVQEAAAQEAAAPAPAAAQASAAAQAPATAPAPTLRPKN